MSPDASPDQFDDYYKNLADAENLTAEMDNPPMGDALFEIEKINDRVKHQIGRNKERTNEIAAS